MEKLKIETLQNGKHDKIGDNGNMKMEKWESWKNRSLETLKMETLDKMEK